MLGKTSVLYTILLWWPHEANSLVSATASACRLRKPSSPWSAPAMAGVHRARSAGVIYLVADSLVVASMVGRSGHGAGASYAGYTDHMDSLDAVFTYGQASCVPPRVRERLPKDPLGHLPPIDCQVGGWLQRLHHESTPSMSMHSAISLVTYRIE